MTAPSDQQAAAREQAIRAMARVIWAHLDTGDNERDKEISRQRATVLVAEMESAGLVITAPDAPERGVDTITISREAARVARHACRIADDEMPTGEFWDEAIAELNDALAAAGSDPA